MFPQASIEETYQRSSNLLKEDIEENILGIFLKFIKILKSFIHDIEVSQQLLDELTSFKGKMTESVDILLRFFIKA